MPKRLLPFAIILGIILLFGLVPGALHLYTDWLWFQEVGYQAIFTTEWAWRIGLFVVGFALAFTFLYASVRRAQGRTRPPPMYVRLIPDAQPLDATRWLWRAAPVACAVFAAGTAAAAGGLWLTVLRFVHRTPFGTMDPVFGRDVAYYVYTLPVIGSALSMLLGLVALAVLMAVPFYLIRGDIAWKPPAIRLSSRAEWHLGALLAAALLLIGAQVWWILIPELLYSRTGPMLGASYTDLNARLPAYRIIAGVAFGGGAFVLLGAARQRMAVHALVAAVGLGLVSAAGAWVAPAAMQRLVVAPTELTREAPQLAHHLDATRRAWGLEDVDVRDLSGDARLTRADLTNNAATIENVRLWDREPLLQTIGQLQEIRTYYDFVTVDDDRYWIDGRYRQVLISPRELNSASLPTRTFINEHLTFTHGMGVTMAPVNQVTPEGLPVLFLMDLPPISTVDLGVSRPQIYYGELTNSFVYVNTERREFDHPAGDANVFRDYTGGGGVEVGGLLRRAAISSRFGALTAFLSQDIRRDSRVLYYRNIRERARKALPFLRWDRDPYIVITPDGELVWILDAYTTTSLYPYAERLADGTSYMRNSVKVVIDAYHGDIRAFVADADDPLIQTYDRAFPGIFEPLDAMPAELRTHIRYPEDLYRIQTALYTIYHMDDPETLYHREDQWQIPQVGRDGGEPFMRRIIMRLPDESDPEFIFVTQFTPRGRDNLAAWMVARNDGDHYGQLVVYRFPRQSLVFGPRQIMNRINQNTEIARQISLWDQRGSQVIRGELLVLPVEEALIYVQPLYLRAEGGRIPELARVIVAYENQVVMESTFDNALAVLFGDREPTIALDPDVPDPPETPGAPVAIDPGEEGAAEVELLRQMREQYERTRIEIERLGEMLRRMEQR